MSVPKHAAPSLAPAPLKRMLVLAGLLVALLASLLTVTGSANTADAAITPFAQRTITEAKRHAGKPYRWGADGPYRFDCSGYTKYVFGRLGKRLPHSSREQYRISQKVSKSNTRVGDLIFTYSRSGRIFHVGIYAGNGYMWAAPKTGDVVRRQRIWTSRYLVGRVR